MSGINTKSSLLNRILARQAEASTDLGNIFALIRLGHETDQATISLLLKQLTAKDAEIATLRKYLGSVLFERRKRDMQIPTLSDHTCDCKPGVCAGRWDRCRHPLEPHWGNRENPLPHITKEGL